MKTTMSPMVAKYQSSGQLQKLLTSKNTPLPVMSGAMGVCSMRFGVWDTSLLKVLQIPRYSAGNICCMCSHN